MTAPSAGIRYSIPVREDITVGNLAAATKEPRVTEDTEKSISDAKDTVSRREVSARGNFPQNMRSCRNSRVKCAVESCRSDRLRPYFLQKISNRSRRVSAILP